MISRRSSICSLVIGHLAWPWVVADAGQMGYVLVDLRVPATEAPAVVEFIDRNLSLKNCLQSIVERVDSRVLVRVNCDRGDMNEALTAIGGVKGVGRASLLVVETTP